MRHVRQGGERQAFNHFVQGTAADLQKMALMRISKWLEERYGVNQYKEARAGIVLHTHDSNVTEAEDGIPSSELTKGVQDCMRIEVAADWLPFAVDSHVCTHLS
jgi:DNA polymerase I-like protein with 3'-5' exonuclease and polymerase domains